MTDREREAWDLYKSATMARQRAETAADKRAATRRQSEALANLQTVRRTEGAQ